MRELADAPGHYSFAHALIQHTLYEDLGPTRRARAHRQVAEALEDLCGDRPGARVGELARHWFSATQPIDLAKAISYSRQAGDAALAALAPADALGYYAQALDLYPRATDPDPVLGIDLAIGLGTAQRQTGDPAFRDTLLGAARRAADLGDTDAARGRRPGQQPWIRSAPPVPSTPTRSRSWRWPSIGSRPMLPTGRSCSPPCVRNFTFGRALERRQALADEAVAIARSSGDDALIVRVLNTRVSNSALQVEQSLPGPQTPWFGPSGSATPCCSSWRPICALTRCLPCRGHRRDGPLSRDHGVNGRDSWTSRC